MVSGKTGVKGTSLCGSAEVKEAKHLAFLAYASNLDLSGRFLWTASTGGTGVDPPRRSIAR